MGKSARFLSLAAMGVLCAALPAAMAQNSNPAGATKDDWAYYGHDAGGTRYSPLTQINRENVTNLKVAWVFHTGDISDGSGRPKRSGLETTPILVDGTLYLTSPFNRVFAVNPETGKQRWVYDPMVDVAGDYGDGLINRGVATWFDASRVKGKPCRRRIFEATLDARLIALDAATGDPCMDFGNRGQISLRDVARYSPGQYHMTSPPVVIDDMVVVGSAIDDNSRVDMSSGVVRAFDARTGKLALEMGAVAAERCWHRHAEQRKDLAHRRGERLVCNGRRSGARFDICPHRQRQPRLLRRNARGR